MAGKRAGDATLHVIEGTDARQLLGIKAAKPGQDWLAVQPIDPLGDGSFTEVGHDDEGAQDRDGITGRTSVRGVQRQEDGRKEVEVGAAHHGLCLAVGVERGRAILAQCTAFGEGFNLSQEVLMRDEHGIHEHRPLRKAIEVCLPRQFLGGSPIVKAHMRLSVRNRKDRAPAF